MATPPIQAAGSPYVSAYSVATSPKVTPSFSVGVGDAILVIANDEVYQSANLLTISNSGAAQAWTLHQSVTLGSNAAARAWTTIVDTAQSMTVTVARSGTALYGFTTWVFPAAGHGGVGVSGVHANASGTTTPLISLNTGSNSFVGCGNSDWDVTDHGVTRSYRTGGGAATERVYLSDPGNYSVEAWDHADVGSAGSKDFGLTTPNMRIAFVAVEILGVAGAPSVIEQPYIAAMNAMRPTGKYR